MTQNNPHPTPHPVAINSKDVADYVRRAAAGELTPAESAHGQVRGEAQGDWMGYDCPDENVPQD